MPKLKSLDNLIGKHVISRNGKRMGKLRGFILKKDRKGILGIIYKRSLLKKRACLFFSDVGKFGDDAIMITDTKDIHVVPKIRNKKSVFSFQTMKCKPVFSEEGKELGKVKDCLFDPETGSIKEYIIGKGLKKKSISEEHINPGQDNIIVKDVDRKEQT